MKFQILAILAIGLLIFGCTGNTSTAAPSGNPVVPASPDAGSAAASSGSIELTGAQVCALLSSAEIASACGFTDPVTSQPAESSAGCAYSINKSYSPDLAPVELPVLQLSIESTSGAITPEQKEAAKTGTSIAGGQVVGENEVNGADYSFRFTVAGGYSSGLMVYKGARQVSLVAGDYSAGSEPASACSSQELVSLAQKVAGKV